ncbi:hypothetical protein SAMN05720468_105100 [Fibrobacter sp. UWEL]|nr:hypothetical protein SAMN05720468_105100 [Fibrobacter sp. UWEL]
MPLDVAIAAIEKYGDGLKEVIPSTMGEPLLYSQFDNLLDFCRGKGVRLNLTTNGTFPGKWKTDSGMELLLCSCSDIKISALAFEENVNLNKAQWKLNVERLLNCRRMLESQGMRDLSSVSLQVTLHGKNVSEAAGLLHWAEAVGVHRIKWNPVVFLSVAPPSLVAEYGLKEGDVEILRETLTSTKLKCGGSLYFPQNPAGSTADGAAGECPFDGEIWILPDGSEQKCPNPERRFGNPDAPAAQCAHCFMKYPERSEYRSRP